MKLLFLHLLFILTILRTTNSNSFGPNIGACDSMNPFGHFVPQQNLNFSLSTSSSTFSPDEDIIVTVNGTTHTQFKGIFLQVRDGPNLLTSSKVGSWDTSNLGSLYQFVACPGFAPNTSIGHNSKMEKYIPTSFVWRAAECVNGKQYFIKATIVVSFFFFQVNVSTPITCIIPKGSNYNTSFENTENPFESWFIDAGQEPYTWTIGSGRTPTADTGPPRANQGNSYIYVEASDPAEAGYMARLSTQTDLTGSFCFSFYYHMFVENNDHILTVKIGGVSVFENRTPLNAWRKIMIGVRTNRVVQIQIEATKGVSRNGDIALDDLTIAPGECNGNNFTLYEI